jgi:hypothetical protein
VQWGQEPQELALVWLVQETLRLVYSPLPNP